MDLRIRNIGGAKSNKTVAELMKIVSNGDKDTNLRASADQLTSLHRTLLAARHKAGLLDDGQYKAILDSEDFYVPFVREFAEEATASGAAGRKWTRSTSGVKRMNQDVDAIMNTADPLEVTISAIERTFKDVGRQRVANILGELADKGAVPGLIRALPAGQTPANNAKTFRQIRNGKPVLYEVLDAELYDAIAGASPVTTDLVTRFMQGVKNVKTAGITLMPDFSLFANPVRDLVASGIQRPDVARGVAEASMGSAAGAVVGAATTDEDESMVANALRGGALGLGLGAYARPLAQVLKAGAEVVGKSDAYREFVRNGGVTEGFFVRDAKDARQVLDQLIKSGVSPSDIINPKRWLDALRYVGSVGEQSTRLAAYKQMREQGAGIGDAVFEAQDRTLRFANVGSKAKWWSSVTPFWNAKVQGWDKLARLIKNPKTSAMGAAMITAPSMALWSINKDNPEYWQRPLWERNLFWLLPKEEGGFYRIPKPFELGYLFASIPERMADFVVQQYPDAIRNAAPEIADPKRALARSVAEMAGSTFEGTIPIPDVLATGLQVLHNQDWFRGSPIERNQNLPKDMRMDENTSAVGRVLGETLPGSPAQMDFILRQTLGQMGTKGLQVGDALVRAGGGEAPSAPPTTGILPRRMVTNPATLTEGESMAQDRIRSAEEAYRGLEEARRSGDPAKVAAHRREYAAELADYNRLQSARSQLRSLETRRRQTRNNPKLDPKAREALLNALRARSRSVSDRVNATPIKSQ